MPPTRSVAQKGNKCQQTASSPDRESLYGMVNFLHTRETWGKRISPTDLELEPKILVTLACAIWQTITDSNMVGKGTTWLPQMIGGTLKGCLRTASSLRFLRLSYLSAKAIALGCFFDVLHHHSAHDNVKEHSTPNDGFRPMAPGGVCWLKPPEKEAHIHRNTSWLHRMA